MEQVYVGERNYDVAIIPATDMKGHGRLGWINNQAKELKLAKKEFEFDAGKNNEHQAAAATLAAQKMVGMLDEGIIKTNTNVLLVLPDSVAPRFFEAKKIMKQFSLVTDEEVEAATNEVTEKVTKDWMSEYWVDALANLVCAYGACLQAGAHVGAIKKSEMYERELESTLDNGVMAEDDAIFDGAKITVDKDGVIAETDLYKAPYLRPGEYTVIDNSYETKNGKVLRYSVSRWESTEDKFIPNSVRNLMKLNKGVSDALPKVELLELTMEA